MPVLMSYLPVPSSVTVPRMRVSFVLRSTVAWRGVAVDKGCSFGVGAPGPGGRSCSKKRPRRLGRVHSSTPCRTNVRFRVHLRTGSDAVQYGGRAERVREIVVRKEDTASVQSEEIHAKWLRATTPADRTRNDLYGAAPANLSLRVPQRPGGERRLDLVVEASPPLR